MSEQKLKDKTAKALMWGALNSGGTQVISLILGIFLARILTPGDYGLIGMITVYSIVASCIQESGFFSALINQPNNTPEEKKKFNTACNSVFWFNITISIFLYAILWFCTPLIAKYNNQPILIPLARYAFLQFIVSSFIVVPRAILTKEMKNDKLTIAQLLSSLISGLIGIYLAFSGFTFWGIATQSICFVLSSAIFYWIFVPFKPSFSFSIEPIKEMFNFSYKILFTKTIYSLNKYLFESILGKFYTKNYIGNYTQSNKWNQMGSSFISGMIQNVAQPMFIMIRDAQDQSEEYKIANYQRAFRKMLRFTSLISFPLMFGLILIAPEFIIIALKEKWINSIPYLQILCVAGAFYPFSELYCYFLMSRNKPNVYLGNMIAQTIIILGEILFICLFNITINFKLFGIDIKLEQIKLMVTIYVILIVVWTFIWHLYIKREIKLGYSKLFKDIMPFIFIAAISMIATQIIVSLTANYVFDFIIDTNGRLWFKMIAKILIASTLYLGITFICGAKILKEGLHFLLKK